MATSLGEAMIQSELTLVLQSDGDRANVTVTVQRLSGNNGTTGTLALLYNLYRAVYVLYLIGN